MESRGRYGCKCPPEIADIPFIGRNCSEGKKEHNTEVSNCTICPKV